MLKSFFLLVLTLCLFYCQAQKNSEVPKIIFDTDIGGDIDDLGALYALHVYADKGLCEIEAVMTSWAMAFHVDGVDAVNTYFGRPDIPIGAYDDEFHEEEEYTWYLGEQFPHDLTGREAPKTIPLYRELLSKSSDTSITIVVTGRLNNMERLLKSESDGHSSLNGKELIAKKVKSIYVMGGMYAGQPYVESNFKWGGKGVSQYVVENFPRPMIFNGGEIGEAKKGYSTGDRINELPEGHILKEGYGYFFKNPPKWTRMESSDAIKEWSIWDIITIQVAVTGIQDYFDIVEEGYNHVEPSGMNEWKSRPDREHAYLTQKMDPKTYADSVIETLFMQPPKTQKGH